MTRWKGSALAVALLASATFGPLTVPPSSAAVGKQDPARHGRNYDRRLTLESGAVSFSAAQATEIAQLRARVVDLLADIDHTTGGTRSLFSPARPLAGARSGDPETIAVSFVAEHLALLGLTAEDIADYRVSDEVYSDGSGVTNIYLQQRHAGIPVYNAQLHATVGPDGALHKLGNQFVPNLAAALNTTAPAISGAEAIGRLRDQEGPLAKATTPTLNILPIRPGEARLVWNFVVETEDYSHWWDVTVDAVDGRVWTLIDWIADDTYKVYEIPVESPIVEVYPTPPPGPYPPPRPTTDERTVAMNPATSASPFGWHDTNGAAGAESTLTTGNNVNACTDRVAPSNSCDPGSQPDGTATLDFAPVLDLTTDPTAGTNAAAAVVNLFYWNNVIHDVEYKYGFNEVAGNFQLNNYGNGGLGNDHVQADAQDSSGTCNANFGTPVDGQQPRMQMYLSGAGCWSGPPVNDGDLDNLVIVHEYGHGISNRLVGGPANVSCLGNSEQPGEGLSDWWGLSLTPHPSQVGTTLRGTGTWLFYDDYPVGIRPQPYSTDPAINTYTYQSAGPLSVPHGVGSVWTQIYWEAYWALVDAHGFDADVYNYTGTPADKGNIRAKRYIIEGLKATVCSPGFVDVRNGILAAAAANYGGEDICTLWEAFAATGLGFDAVQGTNGIGNEINGFALPSTCSFGNAGNDVRVCSATATDHVQNILVGPAYTTPPVDMSVVGNPAGTTLLWSEDPVSGPLPETPTLTIGNLGAAAAGNYNIDVTGLDGGANTATDTFVLTVDAAAPGATTLTSPADGAIDQPRRPTLVWTAVAGVSGYEVEVADDAGFTNIVASTTSAGTSWEVDVSLDILTQYFWRVRATNACGDGANSGVFDFTTANPTVLLVDDDDNSPDVQSTYGSAVNSLAVFDIWDVVAEGGEPTLADLTPYKTIIWFSGDRFTGATAPTAGPQSASETALGSYLELGGGRCVWVTSQDYLWDMGGTNHNVPTAFMQNYLGVGATVSSDNGDYTSVSGANIFSGMGPLTLTYPFSDFSDRLTPSATGRISWTGNNGFVGAVSKQHSASTGFYFAFPWEAFSTTDEAAVMTRVFDHCDAQVFVDGFESNSTIKWSSTVP